MITNVVLIIVGKILSQVSKTFNIGGGSTWPGHIALILNKNFIKDLLTAQNLRLKTILIIGTNGKTTTAKLIETILRKTYYKVLLNTSGANLLNGIASTLIAHVTIFGKVNYDYAIFEVDENAFSHAVKEFTPDYIVFLNLFRDQLDRYGEVNMIAQKWQKALKHISGKTTLILNADDPQIAYLGCDSEIVSQSHKKLYFGLDDKSLSTTKFQHAVDSTYCPKCNERLIYKERYYSHLGDWSCPACKLKRPKLDQTTAPIYPLIGIYNKYNMHAVMLLASRLGILSKHVKNILKDFKPAFGRQEILKIDGKKIQLFLSKNPTSFNQSIQTIVALGAKHILIILNDRIPDGRDVSWIWDVDFEDIVEKNPTITISGDRAYDMGIRLKYARPNNWKMENGKWKMEENLNSAIKHALEKASKKETLYILPTYSAMLETRKITTGKEIL